MGPADKNWIREIGTMPVSRFFSNDSWLFLQDFIGTGPSSQRGYRLFEFFKALDWLALDEIEPNPLRQFPRKDALRLKQEINAYFQAKLSRKEEARVKRESYKLKVFEYFRAHITAEDKTLLEELRDYELDRIGQDVNWRHYFWFSSFKQIDAFVQHTPLQRQTIIAQFKHDVEVHVKNAERLRNGTYGEYYWGPDFGGGGESFDEWASRQFQDMSGYRRQSTGSGSGAAGVAVFSREIQQAFHSLELPQTASLSEVRQQFRQLTLKYHPDRPDGNSEKMKQILAAYDVVKKAYDGTHGH